jgi:hypothetical protein
MNNKEKEDEPLKFDSKTKQFNWEKLGLFKEVANTANLTFHEEEQQ